MQQNSINLLRNQVNHKHITYQFEHQTLKYTYILKHQTEYKKAKAIMYNASQAPLAIKYHALRGSPT